MAEGKNVSKKWEKYSIEGDKLVRRTTFVLNLSVDLVFFSTS